MATYQIYELSARAVMSYAAEQDGVYTFALNRSATEHCKGALQGTGCQARAGQLRHVPSADVPTPRGGLAGAWR